MATLSWAPAASADTRVVVMLTGTDTGGTITFGDNAARTITPGKPLVHDYPATGTYKAIVTNQAKETVATAQVEVRPAIEAAFAVSTTPGEENTVTVTFSGSVATQVKVDYGDGAAPQQLWATPGATTSKHLEKGDYTGTVRDIAAKRFRVQDYTVTGPIVDPDFTLTKGGDANTAVLELTKVTTSQGEITIDWGYSGATETIPNPTVGAKINHTFNPDDAPGGDGVFFVMAYYTADATNPTVKPVTIPFTA